MIDGVRGLGGGHVMRLGAHAADAVGEQRHLFHRPADAEALETAQLGDLEVGVGDVAVFVQEDLDLAVAFKTGDRINRDSLRHIRPSLSSRPVLPACSSEPARLNR